jgi:hypothetical protein
MTYRLSHSLVRALAATTLFEALALVGTSLPQVTFAQGASIGSPSGAPPAEANRTPPLPTPAPEHPAIQPSFDPIAARIKYLHERLRITLAQEPLWAKVAQVMRENAKVVAPLIKERVQSAQHGSAIDSLNAYEKLGEAQLEGLKKFIEAFQALYSGLSADQKKIADSVFRLSPLGMVGGIPQLAEALIAPEPYHYYPYYPSYIALPPLYPGYIYFPPYRYYPPYAYYPYYRPWFWRPPLMLGVSPFFFHRHHRFHGVHRFERPGHHR